MPLENLSSLPTVSGFHGAPVSPSLGENAILDSSAQESYRPIPRTFDAIKRLPLMTQAQVMFEIKGDPAMAARVQSLLSQEDPVKAVIYDQKKAIAHALKPHKFMEMAGKWPKLQAYTRATDSAFKKMETGNAKKKAMGQTPEEDNDLFWQIYGYPKFDRSDEKPVTDISGMGILSILGTVWDKYGKDALAKNKDSIAGALGLEDKDKETPAAQSKMDELVKKAQVDQTAVLATVPDPDPVTKTGLSKKAKIGIGAAAGVLGLLTIGGIIFLATRKKKRR